MSHEEPHDDFWEASTRSSRSPTILSGISDVQSSTPASSANLLQCKLPTEVLIQILSHLSFPDLYGTAQYVCSTWQHIVTRMILGNAVFLRRIINTDYRRLFRTETNAEEDDYLETMPLTDDTWQGVALDTRDLAKFAGLSDERWRCKPSRKFFLICRYPKELYFRADNSQCEKSMLPDTLHTHCIRKC